MSRGGQLAAPPTHSPSTPSISSAASSPAAPADDGPAPPSPLRAAAGRAAKVLAVGCLLLAPTGYQVARSPAGLAVFRTEPVPKTLLYLAVSWGAFWLCRLLSAGASHAIGYLARHVAVRDSAAGLLEYCSSMSRHLGLCVFCLGHWGLAAALFAQYQPWGYYAERGALWLLAMALGVLAEKSLLHAIVTSFHKTVYLERVRQCMRALWVVKAVQRTATQLEYQRPAVSSYVVPRQIPDFGRATLITTFLLENGALHAHTRHPKLSRLFRFLTPHDTLAAGDLHMLFTADCREEAFRVFSPVLDTTGPAEFVRAVEAVYAERRALVRSMRASDDLVRRLDSIMLAVVAAAALAALFPILGIGSLLPFSLFAPFSIIMAETVRSIAAAIVFIFSTHPFDIGDLVYMERGSFWVHRIRLLSTQFRRWDGVHVTFPNWVLATMAIANVRRTGPQAVRFEVSVSLDTSTCATVQALQQRLVAWCEGPEGAADFASLQPVLFELRGAANRMVLVFNLRLRHSFQEPYRRAQRFNKFWAYATAAMRDLNITYEPPAMAVDHIDGPL